MKVPYSWLLDHLDTVASVQDIADTLTKIGLEVEDFLMLSKGLEGFEVAEIVEAVRHPQADRLQVCKVRQGSGEVLQIVCGAPNARAGIKVVLGLPGHTIPTNGIVLKSTQIRGIDSFGMLCSAAELGLEEQSDGILELAASAAVGDKLVDLLGLNEVVLDVNVTPNRSDCLSIRGIARELAAAGLGALKPLDVTAITAKQSSPVKLVADPLVLETEACSHFMGRIITGIQNGTSPQWLQNKLKSIGKKPISALVDITNYLCFDLGRPLHAFDADTIKGSVHVRFARDKEHFKSLKDIDYVLDSEMTVVADEVGPLALAGVMGGMRSSCTSKTINVLLESAYFSPSRTASTGRKLNILSDARYRFERGIDPDSTAVGIEYATKLVLEICGGAVAEVVEIGKPIEQHTAIAFDHGQVKKLTGLSIQKERCDDILDKLGFSQDRDTFLAPSWRHDISNPTDLVEEIVRHYGYDKIVETPLPFAAPETLTADQQRTIKVRHLLASRGLYEVITWSMVDKRAYNLFGGTGEDLHLANPITVEMEYMRPSVIPNLLKAIQKNADRGQEPVFLFEVGPVYKGLQSEDQHHFASVARWGAFHKNHWSKAQRRADIFDVKADAISILATCGMMEGNYQITSSGIPSYYHPGRSGVIQQGPKNVLGYFGEVHPSILKIYDIKQAVVVLELDLQKIPVAREKGKASLHLSPFQSIDRDFAFVVEDAVAADTLIQAIKKVDKNIITGVDVFDVYKGDGLAENQKSLALRVHLTPYDKTFTDEEIQAICQRIIKNVEKITSGVLRS